ncbi:hypothetical protein J5N97_022041 [Dioscorea zingiberensis]|uniref:Peptidase S8/S53 domain-containing protein n=1 Tax=Dioscorea zingiberensis TaxID=325984 RepID=A0A9D5CA17_9LILI|nr:hypothetical protein J5N97_022041 [Dioscorea zingiberensis]
MSTTFNKSTCNLLLIGIPFFAKGYETPMGRRVDETRKSCSPRDDDDNGTHTTTTIADSLVSSTNLLGYTTSIAHRMATHVRLVVYKICWAGGYFSSDILVAMDRAIADGCHVLSISIGGDMTPYYSKWNGYLPPLPAIRTATVPTSAHSPAQHSNG